MGQWHGELKELVEPATTAVLAIDVQQVFTALPGLYPTLDEMLPRLAAFLDAAHRAGVLVVRVRIVVPTETYTKNWQRQFSRASQIGRGV